MNNYKRWMLIVGVQVCRWKGWRLIAMGLFFNVVETDYFAQIYGWHRFAACFPEFVCDVLCLLLMLRGGWHLFVAHIANIDIKKNENDGDEQ